jgi:hypothetical protein
MVPILLLAPDMITMNYYMGTGTLVTTAVLWLLMLVGSMSDD